MQQKAVSDFRVVSNIPVSSSVHCLLLEAGDLLLPVLPGQFVNVLIPGNREVFLRRPFSVFDANQAGKTLSLLVKVLGRGSRTLTQVQPGEKLSLIYPLGRGFTHPGEKEKILAVGGGSGIAPIHFLVKRATGTGSQITFLMGARSATDHIPASNLTDGATLLYATEDGSLGEMGVVTEHGVFRDLSLFDRIYACGPLAMMKAVALLASRSNIPCEVSLENTMACGFGVCLCCIEPTIHGNLCVCNDGPVFNTNDLLW